MARKRGTSKKRQNYADDDRMRDAVKRWFDQQKQTVPTDKPWRTRAQIAKEYNVSESTLEKYTCLDSSKRRNLGQSGGTKKIVSDNNIKIVTQFAIQQYPTSSSK